MKQLPDGWAYTLLNEIGEVVGGGTPSTKDESNFNGQISWITPADLTGYTSKFISRGKRNISEKGLETSSARLMPTGTILFSSRAPIGYTVIASNTVCTNQGFKSLVPTRLIFNEYVYYYLKASKSLAESCASGTTFKEISGERFGKLSIPLPPLNEQTRIVDKIEELFTELDKGVATLKELKQQIKRYRQSVLKYAFEGKLTEKWRQENKDRLEPASKLLEKVKAERKKQLGKNYKELPPLDSSDLPEGWECVRVGNLCDCIVPSRDKPKSFSGNIPWITMPDLEKNEITKSISGLGLKESEILEVKGKIIPTGSVIMTCIGRFGVSSIINKPVVINQQLHAFCPSQAILPKYLMYHIRILSTYMNSIATSTTVLYLNKNNCNSIPINLCSLFEQEIIVEEIEKHFSFADKVELIVDESLNKSEALRQSILKQAFEGKLVSQDPNDEPASVLLEKIKAERKKLEKETKAKKTSKQIMVKTT